MIIADDFLWLHLPKTGGTSMNRLFRESEVAGIQIDPDHSSEKHDSVELRERRGSWRAGNRRRFITVRRLEAWLISDWEHKRRHMYLPDLDFSPVKCGLFYSLRLGGVWVAADWWLHYFNFDEHCTALRLEYLTTDLNQHLLPLLPAGTQQFSQLPMENSKPSKAASSTLLRDFDYEQIRAVNPLWSTWEDQLYGNKSNT